MNEIERQGLPAVVHRKAPSLPGPLNVRELASLSGRDALNFILDRDEPGALVQSLSRVDFYWLVKQIGEDDALSLLRLASNEQWEHLLDMEAWQKDRMNLGQTTAWVGRLMEADAGRMVQWLLTEGDLFCFFYLFRSVLVEVRRGEELVDVPEGFFTLDNNYFIRVLDRENEEMIAGLLRRMAAQDYHRYQAVLLGLAGVLPADSEEELYRRRNVRLAEDGFLPFEEAVSLYSYIRPEAVSAERSPYLPDASAEAEAESLVPMLPFSQIRGESFLVQAAGRVPDPAFIDRLRLEFAGLCNQMISADQTQIGGVDDLVQVCRKAEGYLSVGLEEVSGGAAPAAEHFLRLHPLAALFRIGFSRTLELKWEAQQWLDRAWSRKKGLDSGFWGDAWGGMLDGVLHKRPLYCPEDGEDPRPFESLSEVHRCREVLEHVFALDELLSALDSGFALGPEAGQDLLATFHAVLFTYWARVSLGLEPGIGPLSLQQVKSLFQRLRRGKKKPPFRMSEFKEPFVRELMGRGGERLGEKQREEAAAALSLLWDEFEENYSGVALSDLDERFTRFLFILPDAPSALH